MIAPLASGLPASVVSTVSPLPSGEHDAHLAASCITSCTFITSRLPMRPAGWFLAYLKTAKKNRPVSAFYHASLPR
jgi:hypothetical protein